jgi:hypothetical protein
MPKPPTPPKAALDATTDQGLACMRDLRSALEGGGGAESRLILHVADGFAAPLREQFPGVPLGRVLASAVLSLQALKRQMGNLGFYEADSLLMVAGLAAEQLDREEADRA